MTEVIPRPKALDAVVYVDVRARVLHVRQADRASGYDKLLWKQAWQALRRDEDSGWRTSGPTVWADTPTARDATHVRPGEWATLVAHFPPDPTTGYAELIGRPNVSAIVTVDINSHRFMRVAFSNRP